MRPRFRLLALASGLLLSVAGAPAQTADGPLVDFHSNPAEDSGCEVEVIEQKRDAATSTLQVIHGKGSPRETLVTTTKGIYTIAKARHAAYFITLKEKMRPDGTWELVAGFPADDHPDLKTAFGQPYSETNIFGKKRVCFSVAECASLFEKAPSQAPADPPLPTSSTGTP